MPEGGRPLLVLGLGNPILSDDAVGFHVLRHARRLCAERSLDEGVAFSERCIGGLDLLFEIEGCDGLIVVDAFHSRSGDPGRVRTLTSAEMGPAELAGVQDHWLNLPGALALGRRLGSHVPTSIAAVVIDVGENCLVFGEELSPPVAAAVPTAAAAVLDLIQEFRTGSHCLPEQRTKEITE